MSWARNSVGAVGDDIGLPDVTTADNGKIMEVESGEWKLKEGSGGGGGIPAPENPSDGDVLTYSSSDDAWVAAAPSAGGIFVINASLIPDDPNENIIMDKTWKEIADAMSAGSVCYVLTVYSTELPHVSIVGIPVGEVTFDGSYTVTDCNGTVFVASGENSYPETEFE